MTTHILRPIRPPHIAIIQLAQYDTVLARALAQRTGQEMPAEETIRRRRPRDLGRRAVVLRYLIANGPATPGQIAAGIECETALVSGVLPNLRSAGFVVQSERVAGAARTFIYAITKTGRQAVQGGVQ